MRAQALAVNWLWALSGRKYGLVDVVFRPEWTNPVQGCGDRGGYWEWPSFIINTTPTTTAIALLPGPVGEVTAVEVDGAVLDPSKYQVNRDQLIRVDGGTWYAFQDTTQPTTAFGSWQISYTRGTPVPPDGQFAAGVLACELAKAMLPPGSKNSCRLPSNATQVARNGTSISLDALQLQKGFTGLYEVDQWCRLVNPNGLMQESSVWSPDTDTTRLPAIPTAIPA